jgi:hypothetical protein
MLSQGASQSWRQLVETEQYSAERDTIYPTTADADEALRGITNTLSRAPGAGQVVDNTPVWAVAVKATRATPAVVIYYMWDDDAVTLVSMIEA